MLYLYLLRHAKAETGKLNQDDIDRALEPIGVDDAQALGGALRSNAWAGLPQSPPANQLPFDHIYCSTATRTKQTLQSLTEGYGAADALPSVQYLKALYHASALQMLEILQKTSADAECVLMVGHNPSISELSQMLAKKGDATLMREVSLNYPTCCLTIFQFDCESWQLASPLYSEIVHYLTQ